MLTEKKIKLINDCLYLSKNYPDIVAYGFITKSGETHPTINNYCIRERLFEGAKVYCKAKNGQLIL